MVMGVDPVSLLVAAAGGVGLVRQARTRGSRLLDNPTRARIVQEIRRRPGMLLAELRRRVGCSAGTAQHHLSLLAEARIIDSYLTSQRRHLFPAGIDPEVRKSLSTVTRRSRAMDFLRLVLTSPGIHSRQVTNGLDISRKALSRYVADLSRAGLVDTTIVDGRRLYHPTNNLEQLMATLDGPDAEDVAPRSAPNPALLAETQLRV